MELFFYLSSILGVNQGSIASGFLFQKYIADLDLLLSIKDEVCIDNETVAHLLWAEDLILFSDKSCDLQNQLYGLQQFCYNNHMIVNEIKIKVMVFGNPKRLRIQGIFYQSCG